MGLFGNHQNNFHIILSTKVRLTANKLFTPLCKSLSVHEVKDTSTDMDMGMRYRMATDNKYTANFSVNK